MAISFASLACARSSAFCIAACFACCACSSADHARRHSTWWKRTAGIEGAADERLRCRAGRTEARTARAARAGRCMFMSWLVFAGLLECHALMMTFCCKTKARFSTRLKSRPDLFLLAIFTTLQFWKRRLLIETRPPFRRRDRSRTSRGNARSNGAVTSFCIAGLCTGGRLSGRAYRAVILGRTTHRWTTCVFDTDRAGIANLVASICKSPTRRSLLRPARREARLPSHARGVT